MTGMLRPEIITQQPVQHMYGVQLTPGMTVAVSRAGCRHLQDAEQHLQSSQDSVMLSESSAPAGGRSDGVPYRCRLPKGTTSGSAGAKSRQGAHLSS